MKVLVLGGSIRANLRNTALLLDLVHQSTGFEDYLSRIAPLSQNLKDHRFILTNTELAAGAALLAAKGEKCTVEFFPLASLFPRREESLVEWDARLLGLPDEMTHYDFLGMDQDLKRKLIRQVREADGIIFSSPVYFGDRSSVSNKIMQIAAEQNLLRGKVVGCLSAGAKRNGGQETTNLFLLNEAINLGAYAVGNGPKCSQYGGTVVAGDAGTAATDRLGLESCYGTGKRVAQCATLFHCAPIKSTPRRKLLALVTMDTPKRLLARTLHDYFQEIKGIHPEIEFTTLQLLDGHIERCIACNICPIPELIQRDSYGCIINSKRDLMRSARESLLEADGILIAGLNLKDMSSVLYRYQAFTERTRFVRRNDFELTNVPIAGFTLEETGARANPIFL